MIYVALSVAALMVAAAPATHAQTPVKTIFEKYRLLGTFAVDCGKPASPDNLFYWNRALDDGAIERDQMSGPAKRDWIVFLDNATELRPNEIAVSGTRDGKPINGVWRVEDRRMLQVEVNWDGKEYVGNGRLLQNGSSMPWLNKCDSK
jgi:hypothetical protein